MDAAASFAAWIAALNRAQDRGLLEAAVAPGVRIERHHAMPRGATPPNPAEVFIGIDRAAVWLGRMERQPAFWTVGAPAPVEGDAGAWTIEYGLRLDDFENGGVWVARFDQDGRLSFLSHRPFPLPPQWR